MAQAQTPFSLWRRDQRRMGMTPKTIQVRTKALVAFRRYLGRQIVGANTEDIESWLDTLKIGPSSRSTYLKHLRSFYRYCVRAGIIRHDPTAEIRPPKVPRGLPHPISDDDLAYAISQADPRMKAFLMLAAYEGLRCIEIANLRREDVLTDRADPLLTITTAKGGHQRVLPLNPLVEAALRNYGLPQTGYIFTRDDGGPLQAETVSRYTCRFLHHLGISATTHSGRHSFGTAVYQRTKDIRLTQELLGHATPATTAIYTAFSPGGQDVVRALGCTQSETGAHSGPTQEPAVASTHGHDESLPRGRVPDRHR